LDIAFDSMRVGDNKCTKIIFENLKEMETRIKGKANIKLILGKWNEDLN
jgi:hypothetical protein